MFGSICACIVSVRPCWKCRISQGFPFYASSFCLFHRLPTQHRSPTSTSLFACRSFFALPSDSHAILPHHFDWKHHLCSCVHTHSLRHMIRFSVQTGISRRLSITNSSPSSTHSASYPQRHRAASRNRGRFPVSWRANNLNSLAVSDRPMVFTSRWISLVQSTRRSEPTYCSFAGREQEYIARKITQRWSKTLVLQLLVAGATWKKEPKEK
jgi:hypothetical protein